MAIATYQDLCIDAVDAHVMGRFWAAVLGLELQLEEEADHGPGAKLVGPTPRHTVWIDTVAEHVTVKQRLRTPDDDISWTTLADPDGNEFCAFVD